VSLPDCVSVCLYVNQDITNNNFCTYRLVILHGIRSFLPRRFSLGYFPPQQFPRTFHQDIFLEQILSLENPPTPEQTLVVQNDFTFAIGLPANPILTKRREFSGIAAWISARSPKHWHPQCPSSSRRMPVAILSAGLVTTVIAHDLVNCVYSCLCSVVEVFCGPHLRYLWRTPCTVMCSSKTPSCWQNRPKNSEKYGK